MNTCDCCESPLNEPLYIPRETRRNMAVFQCTRCGLCQSLSTAPFEPDFRQTLSCDADWGNVRHGKGARFEHLRPWLEKVPFADFGSALDIGANRGDFVLWLHENFPDITAVAVEPDDGVTSNYKQIDNIQLITDRFENLELEAADFIYNVHTLEHATSAIGMLEACRELLTSKGLMLLEVPNLDVLSDPQNIEEFFIDKHTFHFSRNSLRQMLAMVGFKILAENPAEDIHNITLLLAAGEPQPNLVFDCTSYAEAITTYTNILDNNRQRLEKVTREKLGPLAERQKLGFWGAGRIINALIKYGGLKPSQVHCLVDKHLWRIIDNNEGFPIDKPESLKKHNPDVIVVTGRSSNAQIEKQARAMGFRHVVSLYSLLNQV